jgi:hypothetical protein
VGQARAQISEIPQISRIHGYSGVDQWSLKNKHNQAPLSVISAKFAVEILLRLFFKDHQFALRYKSVPPFLPLYSWISAFACSTHTLPGYSSRLLLNPSSVSRFSPQIISSNSA